VPSRSIACSPFSMLLNNMRNLGGLQCGEADGNLRASPAFHGHVACVELSLGASTSSTDHSHVLLQKNVQTFALESTWDLVV
jgi:hypothetical protein